ncbi:ph domain protein [Stylonychia lemnae]|uniref:Ph domain protein n=1 Tax=Stylonychia lemnae TaxID=5949 RepID=A0A077ZRX4_STYLE|nr:ph domain protein [Stylonychia lemnae]|eukprot:CDW72110.1 ph domain protein [Stylonychia lemnae]
MDEKTWNEIQKEEEKQKDLYEYQNRYSPQKRNQSIDEIDQDQIKSPNRHFRNSEQKEDVFERQNSIANEKNDEEPNDRKNNNSYQFFRNDQLDEFSDDCITTNTKMILDIKGIGISLVDFQPRELCYLSIYKPKMIQKVRYFKNKYGLEQTRREVKFSLVNMQIDNMTARSFPVILGPRKAFNFQQSLLKDTMVNFDREKQKFLQIYLDHEILNDKSITNQKVYEFSMAVTEITVNFHQYFLNQMTSFINSLTQLVSDEDMTQFANSDTMKNYQRLYEIVLDQNQNVQIFQDGRIGGAETDEILFERDALQENLEELATGQQIRRRPTFKQTKEEKKKESEKKFLTRDKVCPFIKADPIMFSEQKGLVSSKILVQKIVIKAMRIYLTFRVSKIQASGTEGMSNGIINFFMNFANVSDAQLYFSEIEINDAYTNIDDFQKRLTKHYVKQGLEQIYQVFGATDIIGNPVSLINNLGRGVELLYSEPFQGVLQGSAKQAMKGITKGIKSFASNTAIGVSNSVSKMTGTWYMSISNLSGRQISESNLDDPHSIQSGVYQGGKGFAIEFGKGFAGVVTTPINRVREEGKGCKQVSKGAVQGLFGLIVSPVSGILKFVHSTSTGIRNHAQGHEDFRYKRFRFPRFFDEMQIMKNYEPISSHAFAAINTCNNGVFKNENIHICQDVSDKMGSEEQSRFKERILICTDERILYIQNLYQLKLHILIKEIRDITIRHYRIPKKKSFWKKKKEYQKGDNNYGQHEAPKKIDNALIQQQNNQNLLLNQNLIEEIVDECEVKFILKSGKARKIISQQIINCEQFITEVSNRLAHIKDEQEYISKQQSAVKVQPIIYISSFRNDQQVPIFENQL